MSAFEELKGKLREIFQLDRNDLDFGIYRIINLKSNEIDNFLENELLSQVKEGLKDYISKDNVNVQEELNKVIQSAQDLGVNPGDLPKVKELKLKLSNNFNVEKIENEIYSDLYNFFKRYYNEGDFISLRRYKEGIYALPYEGEEVKLHWANADQYYIKSGETLTNYTFKVGDCRVRFEVVLATTEQNNNKDGENRIFKLLEDDDPVRFENGEYIISFTYLPDENKSKQGEINKKIADTLLKNSTLSPIISYLNELTGSEKNRITVILKHLNVFTARNTFDYFIHKDLGKFLRRELDFFIKNEIMHLDDIESESIEKVEQYLGKIKIFRKVANKIISFLAQLEDFQKKLWLKKKFILETNYCITLDRVPEDLYSIIASNEKQKEEWIKLFAIDEINDFNGKITENFLKKNSNLVLDTQFFDSEFKYKLLSSIDNFDEKCDGLLVNSDNFQYLNLSQEKQYEKIKCIYIDPPYNTGNDGFVYKDGLNHSSWMSMMKNRLVLARESLRDDGVIFISIDNNEMTNLKLLCDEVFGEENMLFNIPRITKKGGKSTNTIQINNDYLLCYTLSTDIIFSQLEKDNLEKYKYEDEFISTRGKYALTQTLDYNSLQYSKNMDFIIELDGKQYVAGGDFKQQQERIVGNHKKTDWVWRWSKKAVEWGIKEKAFVIKNNRIYTKSYLNVRKKNGECEWENINQTKAYTTLYYTDNQFSNDNAKKEIDKFEIIFTNPKPSILIKELLKMISANKNSIILDFFAGSGTTGQATINLNREDNGNRKYILVETEKYFDTTTKLRIEKVIYSEDWKEGKPISRKGTSHCFKYIRLESYEDTLDNLKMEKTPIQLDLLSSNKDLKEEYMLNYMMDLETKNSLLNLDKFNHPFDYEMKITRNGEAKIVKVDLVETFNYLIGLNINKIRRQQNIVIVEGETRVGEKTLILWRDTAIVDNSKLDEWFKQNYSSLGRKFDVIYVNCDNNLGNSCKENETWKVLLIEDEFGKRMFDIQDV